MKDALSRETVSPVEKAFVADRVGDVLGWERQRLEVIFSPKSVAVIGATDKAGSVGRTIIYNLITNPFGGTVYPVNPNHNAILGVKAYQSMATVPDPVDLAVIVTPATTVPQVMSECVAAGVKGAIVISAGFKEVGAQGAALETQVLEQARRGHMRVIGPNCLGVMRPYTGLNATFAAGMARPGNVAFISQSGALCTAVLDWSFRENVGFSAFISIGSMLDVGWGDLIDYLGDDPRTQSIVIYMESIGDARAFISAAREVALNKPIIVIKAGRSEAAARAAASHTGALTGADDVLDAAFRRCGVLRVNGISDLFYLSEVLAKQPRPRGPRLAILTNAGGPAVLATDALIAGDAELATLSNETLSSLDGMLPAAWSRNNPVDILGDADPARYAKAVDIVAKDPNSDGLLVVLTPQAMTRATEIADQLKNYAHLPGKPILAAWMGGGDVEAGETILNRANIPTFGYPDTAARMFSYMWSYSATLRLMYETPTYDESSGVINRAEAHTIIAGVRRAKRTLLSEYESKRLLAAYGIPTVDTRLARNADEAMAQADAIGYPVVLKLNSQTITHKTDVGGVRLNLMDADAVRTAFSLIQASVTQAAGAAAFEGVTVQPMIGGGADGYELIVGSSIDPQFGPVLLFGVGGQLVEIFRDKALALPPLNTTLARRMMERTRIYHALQGVRGRKPVDLVALEQLLVRFSQLVAEQRFIKEIDINPLRAAPDGLVALDARVVLHPVDLPVEQLPRLAIRPYPLQYMSEWKLKDGRPVTIRPIRPEDEPLIVKFHSTLSETSVYMRYFHVMQLSTRITHERLTRICHIDYDREMALVVDRKDPQTGEHDILAVGRLSRVHGTNDSEFAILVSDPWQGHGLGSELLKRLVQIGRDEKHARIVADILSDNQAMQSVSRKLGFKLKRSIGDPSFRAVLDLEAREKDPA